MGEEKQLSKEITKEQKSDAQRVIDAFWKIPDLVALRGELQQQLEQDGRQVTPQAAVFHYMGVFDISMPVAIGQLDDDQYMDVLTGNMENNQKYKVGMREVVENVTQSLGFENIAFNQSIVTMILLSTIEVKDIERVPLVVLPSPWSVVQNIEDGEEHIDLRIKGGTAREYQGAGRFHKLFSEFFTGPPEKRVWGQVSGERKRQDGECIKFFKRYEELKSNRSLRDRYDRYNEIAFEFGYSWEAAERRVLRGRKLVKESGEDLS